MMTEDDLRRLVTHHLDRDGEAWSQHPGAVLYSDLASIKPGRFYLLGINPAGKPDEGAPIRDVLCAPDGTNHYADQCWACSSWPCEHLNPVTKRLRPEHRSPMQKRVCDLLDALEVAPRNVLSTNMAFARSTQLATLPNASAWLRRCWPVHQAFLRDVRPAWIVMLGFGAAYYFLANQDREVRPEQPAVPDSPMAWHRRLAIDIGEPAAFETNVLAVAHPSRRGFGRAGLGGAEEYPPALKAFIADRVRGARDTTDHG